MATALLLYAIFGAFAGVLAGLLGVGGGIVIVPILIFTFAWQGFPPNLAMHMALGTSMASIMFTSVSSSLAHHRNHYVDWDVVKRISFGIVVGTYGGSFVASRIPAKELQLFFIIFLFYVASQMILNKKPKPSRQLPGFGGMSLAGGGIGLISSLVGIGGGTLSVPFLLWHNTEAHRAIGTSAAIGFPIALAGCLGYIVNGLGQPDLPDYSLGYLYLPALAGLVCASILTAPFGARIAHRLPVARLKKCFAILLVVVGAKMLWGIL